MDMNAKAPMFSIAIRLPNGKFRTAITSDQFEANKDVPFKVDVDFMADVADSLVKTGATTEARVYNQNHGLEACVEEAYFARD